MDKIERIKKIKELFDNKLLSEEEYNILKNEILETNNELNNISSIGELQFPENSNSNSSNSIPPMNKKRSKNNSLGLGFKVFFIVIIAGLIVIYQLYDKGKIKFDRSTASKEKNNNGLNEISFSGRTANITYEIEKGTLTSQSTHESNILNKIYYIIIENKADNINITMIDYCEDSYGHTNKRYWHKKLDKSWSFWNEASKYANANAFSDKLGYYYLLSSVTEEGVFFCCGRDRKCK